jgi:hypothetical protein
VDQAHRGYSCATDELGFKSVNPLFMKCACLLATLCATSTVAAAHAPDNGKRATCNGRRATVQVATGGVQRTGELCAGTSRLVAASQDSAGAPPAPARARSHALTNPRARECHATLALVRASSGYRAALG